MDFRDASDETPHRVPVPAQKPFHHMLSMNLKETFMPDDPLRQFKNQSAYRRFVLAVQYLIPIFEWAPNYTLSFLKSDILAGITIASVAIPQGISYAKLANLPPIYGLYSNFVPPLVYAVMGTSRDLAIGNFAVASLLLASLLVKEVSPTENPILYINLALTSTFFAGVFQAALGILRLGFLVDLLSHSAIVGYMSGAATVVSLQQLKGIMGLLEFTPETDVVSVLKSVFTQTHHWKWEAIVLGCAFLFLILFTRHLSKRNKKFFWVAAAAPLASIILASLAVFLTKADKNGVQVIGELKKGLNPPSLSSLTFEDKYLMISIKTGIIIGIISLAEGIAAGRSFAFFKNYTIDGNKEMIAFGLMNIAGSVTSCFLTTGPFSRAAVNYNAGCKTAMSNIIMAIAVMLTLLLLTPLFFYTPLAVLSAIIVGAMIGLIDYEATIHLWKVDKIDFFTCIGAYLGVVFASVEIGLMIAVTISMLRLLFFVGRPRTMLLGKIPDSTIYRRMDQYPSAHSIPGVIVLRIDAPILFPNASYLKERITRWINDVEEKMVLKGHPELQYLIIDMGAVSAMDTSGVNMLSEVKKNVELRGLKLVLANPGSEVLKKLKMSTILEKIGAEWVYLTVSEAVEACKYLIESINGGSTTAENYNDDSATSISDDVV